MRLPFAARMVRPLLTTVGIGRWCGLLLPSTPSAALMVITFAWTAAMERRLLAAELHDRRRAARPSARLIVGVVVSQIVWSGVVVLRLVSEGAWFWQTSAVPDGLVIGAGVAAGVWSLRPFWTRFVAGCQGEALEDLDRPILCCLFFLLSGSFVFAAATVVTLVVLLSQRLHQTRFPVVRVNYRAGAGLPAATVVLGS